MELRHRGEADVTSFWVEPVPSDQMSILQAVALTFYSGMLLVGQLLFKAAATRLTAQSFSSFSEKTVALILDPLFLLALATYFVISLFWVWILSQVPLAKAYPFVALNFIFVSASGAIFWHEQVSLLNAVGLVLIATGVILATR